MACVHHVRAFAMLPRAAVLAFGAALSLVARPAPVHACSLLCEHVEARPAGGTVPANLPGVVLRGGGSNAGARLLAVDSGQAVASHIVSTEVAVGAIDTLVLDEPLVPGQHYQLEGSVCDPPRGRVPGIIASYTAGPEQPLPESLGVAVSSPLAWQSFTLAGGPVCVHAMETDGAEVQLIASPEAEPWGDAFDFTVLVDGRPYLDLTRSVTLGLEPPAGLAAARVLSQCGAQDPWLEAGPHEVVIEGNLPGSDVVLRSEPTEIMLECRGPGASSDGCSATGIHARTQWGWLAFAVLLLATRRRPCA